MPTHPLRLLLLLGLLSPAVHAGGFASSLDVTDGKTTRNATSASSTTQSSFGRRVTLEGSATDEFTATWKVKRTDPGEVKDVLVHVFVVRIDRQGQAAPELAPGLVLVESALNMDFPAGQTSGGSQHFRVDGPGVYLIRVETSGDPDKPGKDDMVEAELVVK